MAKFYIDTPLTTEKDSMTKSDGSALTLTNVVRVLYDDTYTAHEVGIAIERVIQKILETRS